MNVLDVTKKGIYRSATGVINALDPAISMVTVQLLQAVAFTTQRIWFPDRIDVKGVTFWRNGDKTDVIPHVYANANKGIGFTDGVNQYCCAEMIDAENNPTPHTCLVTHSDITCMRREQTANHNDPPQAAYSIVGFGVGYVDIETTVNTTSEEDSFVTAIAFGGAEVINFEVWTKDDLGTAATAVPITGLSAEPTLVFIAGNDDDTSFATYDDVNKCATERDVRCSVGVIVNKDSVVTQGSFARGSVDQSVWGVVDGCSYIDNSTCMASIESGSLIYSVSADNFAATSFDLTPSANPSNAVVGGCAVTFSDDINIKLVDTTYPTSTPYEQTDVGFKPFFGAIFGMESVASYGTISTATEMCESAVFFTDKNIIGNSIGHPNGINSNGAYSMSRIIRALNSIEIDTATQSIPADTLNSTSHAMNSTGWSFVLDTTPVAEIKGIGLAIG